MTKSQNLASVFATHRWTVVFSISCRRIRVFEPPTISKLPIQICDPNSTQRHIRSLFDGCFDTIDVIVPNRQLQLFVDLGVVLPKMVYGAKEE